MKKSTSGFRKEDMKLSNGTVRLSTVIGIIVLVMALTTATFAWFSTSASITAGIGSFTATTEGEGDISLYWGDVADNVLVTKLGSSSNNLAQADGMIPMIPNYSFEPTSGVTYEEFIAQFITASIGNEGSGQGDVFVTGSSEASPYTVLSTESPSDGTPYDVITCVSESEEFVNNNALISIKADFSAVNKTLNHQKLRVAVFGQKSDSEFYYLGTLGAITTYDETNYSIVAHGQIVKGNDISSVKPIVSTSESGVWKTSASIRFNTDKDFHYTELSDGNRVMSVAFKFVVWYDGNLLRDDNGGGAGESANVSLTFSVTNGIG